MPVRHPTPFLGFAAVALIAIACATVRPAEFGIRSSLSSAYVLTGAEISGVQVNTAYDAIQRLKPNFLVGMRGFSESARRTVYLDGAKLTGLEDLRIIPASSVRQVLFLNGVDATTRYGTGNGAGALVVTTWPGPSER